MSSEEGFFDVIHLGVFAILSPAFDIRFYGSNKPPPTLIEEVAYAVKHFHSILRVFTERFHLVVEGLSVSHLYVVDRMLAEFAAAAVVFSKALPGADEMGEGLDISSFPERIEGIIQDSHPQVFDYFSRCLNQSHKHFIWTGPHVQILPRSKEFLSLIPLTTRGELLDLPSHSLYTVDVEPAAPAVSQPSDKSHSGKRHERVDQVDIADKNPKKQRR